MNQKEKLQYAKDTLLKWMNSPKKEILTTSQNTSLKNIDSRLEELLEEDFSLTKIPVSSCREIVRLIIILDISGSMQGTEEEIYYGLQKLVKRHKQEDILFNLVAFNWKRTVLLDDVFMSNVNIPKIEVGGATNLNGTLLDTMREKCSEGVNLTVVLSDGADNTQSVSANLVKEWMMESKNKHNHFYFLGEPNEEQTEEEVYFSAHQLGFNEDNISVFTRQGKGNRLNFEVISKMLEELLEYGRISKTWSEPIKKHYLRLTDKRY